MTSISYQFLDYLLHYITDDLFLYVIERLILYSVEILSDLQTWNNVTPSGIMHAHGFKVHFLVYVKFQFQRRQHKRLAWVGVRFQQVVLLWVSVDTAFDKPPQVRIHTL